MAFLEELAARAGATGKRVVLAEGDDPRVREAARRARKIGLETIVVLEEADAAADLPPEIEVRTPRVDPATPRLAELYQRLGPSELDARSARATVSDPLLFAGLLVRTGQADGAVAGAASETAKVIRAALRSVGTGAETRTVSGAFYMVVPAFRGGDEPEVLTFTDSGVVPEPDAEQLAEIAARAAEMRTAIVGDAPRVAFLSYSTAGSAEGASVERMRAALAIFRRICPGVAADGEMQADAALIEGVGRRKAPNSPVAGRANVLVFPDLDAGNIAYKLVERLAGATAIGPILHGLARPFNDLSRGADAEDILWVACVTALMAAT